MANSALFNQQRTIRAQVNPLDKSTIVSIYPKHIVEYKHTIQPGKFEVMPGTYDNPSTLVVGSSSWWKYIDEHQPILEIPQYSVQVAESVVKDYCNGILACDMGDRMPGLFFVPGEFDVISLKMKHGDKIEEANRKQRNWFQALVHMADALWARTNGNPISISDDMRLAAKELNFLTKDWLKDHQASELVRCKACGTLKNPLYPICPNCKSIDNPERAKELGLTFAQ